MVKKRSRSSTGHRSSDRSQDDPGEKPFTPDTLDRTIIAIPLLDKIDEDGPKVIQDIIIDVNLEYPGGRKRAREVIWQWIDALPGVTATWPGAGGAGRSVSEPVPPNDQSGQLINRSKSEYSQQYLFGRLSGENIRALVRRNEQATKDDQNEGGAFGSSALYRIWLDHEVKRFINQSISTVKADAARNAFSALGNDIVWAVIDTGVDRKHPHFQRHKNLELKAPVCTENLNPDIMVMKSAENRV